jgi:P-type Ca2+ transporter type 2C
MGSGYGMQSALSETAKVEPYQRSVHEVLASLSTDARSGLSEAEALERLKRYGANALTAEKSIPGWRKFLAQFTDAGNVPPDVEDRGRRDRV